MGELSHSNIDKIGIVLAQNGRVTRNDVVDDL